MPTPAPAVEQILGTICLLADDNPSHTSAKLDYGDGITALDALKPSGTDTGRDRQAREAPRTDAGVPGAWGTEGALGAVMRPGGSHAASPSAPATPGSEEAFYLLATFCFDLQRKMEYLFKTTRAFGEQGDAELARDLLADQLYINEPGLTWKQRAFRAEARMLELRREIGDDHRDLLKRVARGEGTEDEPRAEEPRAE